MTANGPYGKVILETVNFEEILRRKGMAQRPVDADEFKVSDKPASRPRQNRRGRT
jgi:hypothetical protein